MLSDAHLLPIREVTRLTGVHPVTLRAWERRYGLVVPQRTAKGHRLYAHEDVQRIRLILQWLDRGVAVGQVKSLLEQRETPAEQPTDDWQRLRQLLVECIAELAERRLEQQINQAMALYPASTLCEQLFLPLLDTLQTHWQQRPGTALAQVFFHTWLRSKLGMRVYHNNRQLTGRPVLLVNATLLPFDPQLWLCAWLLSDSGQAVEVFDWPLPAGELRVAVSQLQARALILSINAAVDARELKRALSHHEVPKVLFGNTALLYRQTLEATPNLSLCTTPLQACRLLAPHLLQEP